MVGESRGGFYFVLFDGLLDDLTGRETLKIFCLLHGIHRSRVRQVVEELAKSFGFSEHMDKEIKAYSGGNKRKLSAAISIIGGPTVIYLDEPTTGLDPAARRHLWNTICDTRDAGKSIVLTSHSMEECEALCTRIAIMVNGELKCIGATQHLKNKFSKGVILKIKLKRASEVNYNEQLAKNIKNIKDFVEHQFPQAILQDEHQSLLTFSLPISNISWSKIFGLMESKREQLNIEVYSISQTTLEQIFLEFAKHQSEDPRAIP